MSRVRGGQEAGAAFEPGCAVPGRSSPNSGGHSAACRPLESVQKHPDGVVVIGQQRPTLLPFGRIHWLKPPYEVRCDMPLLRLQRPVAPACAAGEE